MSVKLRPALVAAAVTLATAWAATPAAAQGSSPSGVALARTVFASASPRASYNALTPTQRAAFLRAETPASRVLLAHRSTRPSVKTLASPNFSGTFWDSAHWGSKAAAGNTLYTWWQATKVWISSGHVTQVSVYNYGYETSTPGWREGGISTQKYNAGWEGRGLVIAKFILGVAGWDVQHTTNCGQIRLNGDAVHYLISSSCDLN